MKEEAAQSTQHSTSAQPASSHANQFSSQPDAGRSYGWVEGGEDGELRKGKVQAFTEEGEREEYALQWMRKELHGVEAALHARIGVYARAASGERKKEGRRRGSTGRWVGGE